ncbi:hypothetical protein [Cohnella sp. GCM10027633]|uniref:capsular polysaccharide export protein, LipB/KpsS family n=1 Tax=unclassified Cohnella TaxID=2636738 RepID=UPI0036300CA9
MKTVYVFNRPFTNGFNKVYKDILGSEQYRLLYISDFKYRDDVGLVTKLYKHLNNKFDALPELSSDYEAVIRRCRYLRFQSKDLANRLINSVWKALQEIFAITPPDYVIGLPIDNYVLDLLHLYCQKNNIACIFPVQSFLPNLTRMTCRGEWRKARDVSDDEVTEYLAVINKKNFRPTWLSPKRNNYKLLKLYVRERMKKVFFESMKILKNDKYSFHYNCIFPMPGAITVKSIDVLEARKMFVADPGSIEQKAAKFKKVVFFPLQFSPETSLDYYIEDSRFSQYEDMLRTVLNSIPSDTLLIIKEHPDLFGFREKRFYEKFLHKDNVVLADVDITVQEIFNYAQYLLVTGAASTGAEAVVKGKTVISLGGAFYSLDGMIHEIKNFSDAGNWGQYLTPIHNDEDQIFRYMRNILGNTVKGPYDFVRTSPDKQPITEANLRAVMNYLENPKN